MKKFTFVVEGLHCEKCDAKVSANIKSLPSVKSVESSYVDGKIEVVCKDNVELIDIKKLIVGLGHKILDTQVEDVQQDKKGFLSFFKRK